MAEDKLGWTTLRPELISAANPATAMNLVGGVWLETAVMKVFPDPMTGEEAFRVPETQIEELQSVSEVMKTVPRFGLHNPLNNTHRYNLYGQICAKASSVLFSQEGCDFFTRLIMRCIPKSRVQAEGEVKLLRVFLQNYSGDQVRYLARGFSVPGDHPGQETCGYRWPYGSVAIISPFNFPLEIPALQLLGALFMGNKVVLKPDPRGAICIEQFVRLLIHCGMPVSDVVIINGTGTAIEHLISQDLFRCIQFTGSTRVAEHLSRLTKGKVRFEDSGFNWKILGPDVDRLDYVAYVCDQDAYAFSGQKCSAEEILLAHRNWVTAGIWEELYRLANRRTLADLTITPLLTWTNERIQKHLDDLLQIPGAKVLFGGTPVADQHSVPAIYGLFSPTAVYIPLSEILRHMETCTVEVFGPIQIVTDWSDLSEVLQFIEKLDRHLTAGVVSNDPVFLQQVLGASVNGTTYVGLRARTSGAPQNHWFGGAGDPRGSGIGTRESIIQTWSCHREIIYDNGPVSQDWTLPPPS